MKKINTVASFLIISLCIGLVLTSCGKRGNRSNIIDEDMLAQLTTAAYGTGSPEQDNKTTTEFKNEVITVDAFKGLSVQFDGISPFCTISFNDALCNEDTQQYVTFSLAPDEIKTDGIFAINDSVTVYAILDAPYDEVKEYTLKEKSKSYTVKDVASYLTNLDNTVDLSLLNSEASDYLASITAFNPDDYSVMGSGGYYKSSTAPVEHDRYFSTLKKNLYPRYQAGDFEYFNRYDITYSVSITNTEDIKENRYFTVTAYNLVLNADGSLGWGKEEPAALGFDTNNDGALVSLNNTNFTSQKGSYNVNSLK